jgi:hypothetical protein
VTIKILPQDLHPYPKKTHWIHREVGIGPGTLSGLKGTVIPKRPGKGRLRMKPWNEVKRLAVDRT